MVFFKLFISCMTKIKNQASLELTLIYDLMIYQDNIEIRRVQALQGERSFTIVLPKECAVGLGIGKGDFLKCSVDGRRLVVEKVEA
jgi:hypothetical protein